jgi:hypothetical protein
MEAVSEPKVKVREREAPFGYNCLKHKLCYFKCFLADEDTHR